MATVEIDTSHSTHPWVLRWHRPTEQGDERYATREEAERRADDLKVYGSEDIYLVELFVDAGCLHAIG